MIVWRIIVGVSLIPAFGTLYQRLTLPESTRYEKNRVEQQDEMDRLKKLQNGADQSTASHHSDTTSMANEKEKGGIEVNDRQTVDNSDKDAVLDPNADAMEIARRKAHFKGPFTIYRRP